ncbi:MAG: hypothetical protein OEQ39_06510 [Gammaproteobacteria bacterium]|nr:hypothetical protein [Gammaproteobacteria bacterium]
MPPPVRLDYIVVIGGVSILAALYFLTLRMLEKLQRPYDLFLSLAMVLAGVNPLNFARLSLDLYIDTTGLWWIGAILSVCLLVVVFHRLVRRLVYAVVLVFAPFILITFVQATWLGIVGLNPVAAEYRLALPPVVNPLVGSRRVMWITFDELDGRYLFSKRPSDHDYPNFDSFKWSSVYLSCTSPPGGLTLKAMPALWIGRPVSALRTNENELLIRSPGQGTEQSLDTIPNLFRTLKRARSPARGHLHI